MLNFAVVDGYQTKQGPMSSWMCSDMLCVVKLFATGCYCQTLDVVESAPTKACGVLFTASG